MGEKTTQLSMSVCKSVTVRVAVDAASIVRVSTTYYWVNTVSVKWPAKAAALGFQGSNDSESLQFSSSVLDPLVPFQYLATIDQYLYYYQLLQQQATSRQVEGS